MVNIGKREHNYRVIKSQKEIVANELFEYNIDFDEAFSIFLQTCDTAPLPKETHQLKLLTQVQEVDSELSIGIVENNKRVEVTEIIENSITSTFDSKENSRLKIELIGGGATLSCFILKRL